ncbi:FAD/NAD(P)-binding protein [Streptomyces zagrosensis]|uniref:FAD-dependent urate hydroxylase HpyO/Asp monooxygenase CreE-like FAD/NAD(P)-binding domain-containing protein n=1 Tax=Streptomyces zagrosensis TaxID=1042984 RepID=A0A7W9QB57_9ACTN|nr:FAD/NAD(P)-binding protein [Streptomyces zagrosensis]MBB5936970.1 hypothetical protein [Streptomyces zagrosensis]
MTSTRLDVCVIGAGPRGLSVLERLCVNARHFTAHDAITVHVVDPHVPGAGRVWRTDQSRHLLMNTVACQVTVFTDDSVEMEGPLAAGPSLFEWARAIAERGPRGQAVASDSAPKRPSGAARQPCAGPEVPATGRPYGAESSAPAAPGAESVGLPPQALTYDAATLAEAAALGPDTYPTRALYGSYLSWAFQRIVAGAPAKVTLRVHAARAVALDDDTVGTQTVALSNGARLTNLSAVVLAQGHVPVEPSPQENDLTDFAARHGLVYVPPSNPADVDLSAIEAGKTVLLRGLGLNFFDHMALLTEGRGGSFERVAGRLVYRPSGREPQLYAGSRRGMPYHARGENEKGVEGRHEPLLLTPELIAKLRAQSADGAGIDFRDVLWPLVAREVETVYYCALLTSRGRSGRVAEFQEHYLAHSADDGQPTELLAAFGISPADRWDWDALQRPYAQREFSDPSDFHDWLLDHLREDLDAAHAGNVSGALKAALDVLRDLRNELRLAVDHGGLSGDSYRSDLDRWYTPLNAYLSIGPPARRIEELLALIESGTVRIAGPGMRIEADRQAGVYVAESPAVPGSRVTARALIEARLPEIDLRRTADPLLRHLLNTGQCAPYRIPSTLGDAYETGGLSVTERPYHLLAADGVAHPRRFAFGVPTESVHWVTAAGIRPGVNSVTLGDSDAIARAVLGNAAGDAPTGRGALAFAAQMDGR